ncbi:nudix-type nucleoside diphosphatase (YffH/AdpP family) [Pseudomonas sp. JAI111]|jgi:nudix-type nucleoside diphosphatase (YffH/AdpP family)|uniref:NUDIX domain-containing protein n=1 Tax=Pseudomonas sp. JAI111 TaxID=2735913 RepID=UPI00216711AA|nr:NUDIX domain-containing protein [Pseudomonas sp. JAI111]MCS3840354.1 nudix-type nucleoside diphosphatase (YffH/AdpP family) [Pseudomonas sp. JAI111]
MSNTAERVNIIESQVLSHDWYLLRKISFDYLRNNGEWQRQTREVYDRGNGAAILLFNREKRTVVLTRQFRLPVFVNGHDGLLIEVAAGLLEGADPEERIRAEAEEETGYRVHHVQKVFESYMSPGSVTEKLHFFIAEYDSASKVSDGGGLEEETEELEVLEWAFEEALEAFYRGEICDAKTIMLLQYAAMKDLFGPSK